MRTKRARHNTKRRRHIKRARNITKRRKHAKPGRTSIVSIKTGG